MKNTLSSEAIIENARVYHQAALNIIQSAQKVIEDCRPADFLTTVSLELVGASGLSIPPSSALRFAVAAEDAMHKQILQAVREAEETVREDLAECTKPSANIQKRFIPKCSVMPKANHLRNGEREGLNFLQSQIMDLSAIVSERDSRADYEQSTSPLRNGKIEVSNSIATFQWFFDDLYYFVVEYACGHAVEVTRDIPTYKDPLEVIQQFKSWATLHAAGKEPFTYRARRKVPYREQEILALGGG